MKKKKINLAVIGLGYVGLPLAVEFAKKRSVIGFDTNFKRIKELKKGIDKTLEVKNKELQKVKNLILTTNEEALKNSNCFIIAVPTPVDELKKPDLSLIIRASQIVGKNVKRGDIIIYESTVYPGATEEICVPELEKYSGLKFNVDFYCGYSPERANPGDKEHRLTSIKKITSGSTPEIADIVDSLYKEIIVAGTYKTESIKVAEAAKVIENTQRDLNIALINELAIIFNKMSINTESVLNAAETKWNFLPFRPGLVGGHCIGVDPYYLTHKSQSLGYKPKIILSGRHINDSMGLYVVKQLLNRMKKKKNIVGAKVLIMGLTFKENCPDIRNSRIIDIINELKKSKLEVDVFDPCANHEDVKNEYNINLISKPNQHNYDAIIIAVAHSNFKSMGAKHVRNLCKKNGIIYDLKYIFLQHETDMRL
jgi:UDP-N-acetyl-D-glucosamine/UDP-N-acetyl-D-galactosamine dehydrogenase